MPKRNRRLIETDAFPFEFLSRVAERESWRKELHRPVYHVHKWWAKRLGSGAVETVAHFRAVAAEPVDPGDAARPE